MNVRAMRALLMSLIWVSIPMAAMALPGDAAAILAHCGPPSSDQILHQDTPQVERVISYSDIQLSFVAEGGDWSFTHAVRAGVSLPQSDLFAAMHCVSDALEEVSAAPPKPVAVAGQTSSTTSSTEMTHEYIFMGVAALVLLGVLFFAIRPYTRSEVVKPVALAPRAPQRRPSATGVKFRRPDEDGSSGIQPSYSRIDSTNDD